MSKIKSTVDAASQITNAVNVEVAKSSKDLKSAPSNNKNVEEKSSSATKAKPGDSKPGLATPAKAPNPQDFEANMRLDEAARKDDAIRYRNLEKSASDRIRKALSLPAAESATEETASESAVPSDEVKDEQGEKDDEANSKDNRESESAVEESAEAAPEQGEEKAEVDPLAEIAKAEGIDPELAKDEGIRKLLKSLNKTHARWKEAEAKAKSAPTIQGQSSEEWTEEFGSKKKEELTKTVNYLQDILDTEVQRDDNNAEIPVEINGQKYTRKEIRQYTRKAQEDLIAIPEKVKSYQQFAETKNSYNAMAAKQITWYGDDESPAYKRATELWTETLSKGANNVPYAEYIFARGFDALLKDAQTGKKESVVVKKPEPPKASKSNSAASPAKTTETGGPKKLESMLREATKEQSPFLKQEKMAAYYREKIKQHYIK